MVGRRSQFSSSPPRCAPIGADAPQSTLDNAASHTRIVVIQPGKTGDRRPVVALANPVGTKDAEQFGDTYQGILNRELTRQALLIAARDELGLATRDEVLGDAISEKALDKTASPIDLITVLHTVEGKPSPRSSTAARVQAAKRFFTATWPTAICRCASGAVRSKSPRTGRAPSFPKC